MQTPIKFVPILTNITENIKFIELADDLGVSQHEAIGLWVAFLAFVARNHLDGRVNAPESHILSCMNIGTGKKDRHVRAVFFKTLVDLGLICAQKNDFDGQNEPIFYEKVKKFGKKLEKKTPFLRFEVKKWQEFAGKIQKSREKWKKSKQNQRSDENVPDLSTEDVHKQVKKSKEKKSKEKKSVSPEARPNGLPPDPADQIFAHWQTYHPTKHATTKRVDAIRKVLPEISNEGGAGPVETIKKAIDGYHISPFHLGENVEGKQWLDLTLICRGRDQVLAGLELFNEHAPKPPPKLRPEKIIREKLNAFGVDYGLGRPHPAEFQALLKIDPTVEELQQVAKKIPPRTPESTWTAYCRELCQIRSAA
jgi:hypothetical protein